MTSSDQELRNSVLYVSLGPWLPILSKRHNYSERLIQTDLPPVFPSFPLLAFSVPKRQSHRVAQAGPRLGILLFSLSLQGWDYRGCMPGVVTQGHWQHTLKQKSEF